jgi:hypothetical protein
MTRKLKALGLALVAVFAMSALAASAASAQEFHSSTEKTTLSGTQIGNHSFTVGSGFGAITCKVAKFKGTQSTKTAASQEMTPEYKECTDSFGRVVDVTVEGHYLFTPPTITTGSATVHFVGVIILTITSPPGTSVCHVTIRTQTIAGSTIYHNRTPRSSGIIVTTNATGIHSTTEGGLFNCGVSNGEHTEGTYTGETEVTGGGSEIWVE